MKYIVKNCPNMTIVKGQDLMCFEVEKMHCVPCQNRNDCVIKQIVELCEVNNCLCDNCDGAGYFDGCKDTDCSFYRLMQIETFLGIEEE